MKRRWFFLILLLIGLILSACQAAATQAPAPSNTQTSSQVEPKPTSAPLPTSAPTQAGAPSASATPSVANTPMVPVVVTPVVTLEQRMVELEWPLQVPLGESDLVRLSLVPYQDNYVVQAEFPEHPVEGQQVKVERLPGYILTAIARLDGTGFDIAPSGDQEHTLAIGQTLSWRWSLTPHSPGQQRISLNLTLRWTPESSTAGPVRTVLAFSRGLNVQVISILGLTRGQAMTFGAVGLLFSLGLLAGALILRPRRVVSALEIRTSNPSLILEPYPGLILSREETSLLQSLFNRYSRLVIQREFLSGYSGARTFLVLPIRRDGRSDAATIIKIGWKEDVLREYGNYETYVKDRLPPITARIQHAPVTLPGSTRAGLQYTFIAEPGRPPVSLRQALLESNDLSPIRRLYETFGPNWWMQRQPSTFRLGQEMDRLLPPHLVLEPVSRPTSGFPTLVSDEIPADLRMKPGDMIVVPSFSTIEKRADGQSLTLTGRAKAGLTPLRIRWLSQKPPNHTLARVISTRQDILNDLVGAMDRFGLPDPLPGLDDMLCRTIPGTQSVIHGDLNLENVLVGPGGFVWLIDFAQTREGHPLFDFAHLAAEMITQIIAVQEPSPERYVDRLRARELPLLTAVEGIVGRLLFNPSDWSEWQLVFATASIGALKYANNSVHARHLLYLTAAYYTSAIV